MGNGKSKEGGKGGLLAVSRNSLDEGPPTKSSSSVKPNQRVNIYVDETSVNKNNNTTTTNNNNTNSNNNNSLHQSQISNDSSSTTNNNNNNTATTTTGGSTPPNNQNPNNTNTATTISNTDSTTSSSPNASTTNNSVLTPSNQQQQHHVTFGANTSTGSSIVFGVDVSVAVQRSCKLILKLLLQKKQQDSVGCAESTANNGIVEESISEEKKNEYKHPLASDEEIEAIEKVCANLDTLFIPEVLRQCLRFLNSYSSLLEQGVYRIPGDTQKMKEYREAFDKGQSIDFLAENREIDRKRKEAQDNGVTVDIVHHGIKHDAHDVAGLIKLFLRELPGDYHLFTPQTANEFSISHLKNFATEEEKVESVRSSLFRVPRSNRETLKALCEHFRLIIKYEKSNKMTTDNLLKCICGTSPYVLAFYFMVQFFDIVFKEEKKETKTLTEEDMNSTKNIEWLLRAQNDTNNVLSLGNLSHLTGGNNNLSNEALAGKAMSARESRRKSYYQRQQRNDSNASEETPTTDQSDFASPPTMENSNSDNLDPITLALLRMKKDKDTQNDNTIATNTVDSQEQNDSSITVEM